MFKVGKLEKWLILDVNNKELIYFMLVHLYALKADLPSPIHH